MTIAAPLGIRMVAPDALTLDPAIQPRVQMDGQTVDDYAEDMEHGDVFPPVVAFEDTDGTLWVAEGFHRASAAVRSSRPAIPVDVRPGGWRAAYLHACGSNDTHGLRRTNRDKRRVVERLLFERREGRIDWSNREIARCCSVSPGFVDSVAHDLSAYDRQIAPESRTAFRGDQHYSMQVGWPCAACGLLLKFERARHCRGCGFHWAGTYAVCAKCGLDQDAAPAPVVRAPDAPVAPDAEPIESREPSLLPAWKPCPTCGGKGRVALEDNDA